MLLLLLLLVPQVAVPLLLLLLLSAVAESLECYQLQKRSWTKSCNNLEAKHLMCQNSLRAVLVVVLVIGVIVGGDDDLRSSGGAFVEAGAHRL